MSLIPAQIRIALIVSASALAFGAVYLAGSSHGAERIQAKWNAEKFAQGEAAKTAEAANRAKERAFSSQFEKAQNDARTREIETRTARDAAARADSRLRDAIAALRRSLPGDSAEACRITADAALAVFGECAAEAGELAEAADRHASDARLFSEAWPSDN